MSISGIGSPPNPINSPAATGAGSKASATTAPKSAADQFLEYAQMSPAQRMRASILDDMGLTDDDIAKMDADKRAAINDQVAQQIRDKADQSAQKQTGMIVDVSA